MSDKKINCCEMCEYFIQDEDGSYGCEMALDEDEMYRFLNRKVKGCAYFKFYDEYKSVQKQN